MVLYVSLVANDGKSQDVATEIIEGWDLHWRYSNDAFESIYIPLIWILSSN